jgi:hypothetical protein
LRGDSFKEEESIEDLTNPSDEGQSTPQFMFDAAFSQAIS